MSKETTTASPFPLARGRTRGYQLDAVDAFLAAARTSYEQRDDSVRASDIREASFPLTRNGYDIAAVDRALARLEDAFAARERQQAIDSGGAEAWVMQARADAQVILNHVSRKRQRRFDRTSKLTFGYRRDEVDYVTDHIARFLRDGETLTADQLRAVGFRMQRGGYREEQVDALLDATVGVVLAVR